ncbi:MAG: biotin/lipoyl-binding protein [Oscillospiraceae bacterium]|nr:biotin/lipoyl-binding protein [Oscillospiraceae bacterium]
MKKNVKIIIAVAVCLLVAVGVFLQLTAPLAVELVEVTPQTAQLTFTKEGVFSYRHQHQVFPMVSGEVLEVLVEEGQQVSEGDVLAVINASDYQRQIDQLRSNIAGINGQIHNLGQQEQAELAALRGQRGSLEGQLSALDAQAGDGSTLETQLLHMQAVVNQNEESVRRARQTADALRDEWGRESSQYYQARQVISQAQATAAASRAQFEALRASDAGLEGQRQSLLAQIEAIDERLATNPTSGMITYFQSMIANTNASIAQMEEQVGRAEVTSPVSGRITSLPIFGANLVGPGQMVAAIGFDEIIEVYIPTREIESVSVGDEVELIFDRRFGAQSINGRVIYLGEMAQVRLSALGVEERRVRILIQPAAENELIVGYAMDVRFTVLSLPDSLVVPKTAIFRVGEYYYVWVVDEEERAAIRRVVRGVELRDGFVIDDGLEIGDAVVRDANNSDLAAGARLTANS